MNNSIKNQFSIIKDPRLERKRLHSLDDILVAMFSGAEGYTAIEAFGRNKKEWLEGFLSLKNGIPSHDCVLTRLPPEELQLAFIQWAVRHKLLNKKGIMSLV